MDPVRIFVGTAARNEDLESQSVLAYTLHKYASKPLEITWMQQSEDPASFWYGWNTQSWVTPFSGFRYGIPAACGFQGRAIYMDSDMIVQDDIAKLWDMPLNPGAAIIAKNTAKRLCVMLMDAERLRAVTPPIEQIKLTPGLYRQVRDRWCATPGLVQVFPADQNWNCLDGETYKDLSHPHVKCIHYTAIDTQPQMRHALTRLKATGQAHWFKGTPRVHSRGDLVALFDRLLEEAKQAGFPPEQFAVKGLGKYAAGGSSGGGWVKPGAREEQVRTHHI